jgi:hypothetical protein
MPEGHRPVKQKTIIRPPDLAITTTTLTYMGIESHEAVRRILDLAFRDAHTALDLTYGDGGFWRDPPPPGLEILTNNPRPKESKGTDLHLDFTRTLLDPGCVDVTIFDPPHLADGGRTGLMATRYGTATGGDLDTSNILGTYEAWRLARIGCIVKVTDHAHGGEMVLLSDTVKRHIPVRPYLILHTYRPTFVRDGKWTVQRAPRNNGATYLAFRKGGHKHKDFEKAYAKQLRENPNAPLPGQMPLPE